MRRLIYHVAMTVDGYIGHSDGSVTGFLEEGDHISDYVNSLAEDYDDVLMGTNTYTYGYRFGMEPGQPAYEPFNLKNYIFSRH